jgi:hypothetical protein
MEFLCCKTASYCFSHDLKLLCHASKCHFWSDLELWKLQAILNAIVPFWFPLNGISLLFDNV